MTTDIAVANPKLYDTASTADTMNTAVFIVSAVDAVTYSFGFATAMSVVTSLVVFALDAVNEDLGLGQGTKAE